MTEEPAAYGAMVCASCRRIIQRRRKFERLGEPKSFDLAVCREQERQAKAWGRLYLAALEEADGLALENALGMISRKLCRRNLYKNYATYFNQHFDASQRRILIELLFRMLFVAESRSSWTRAANSPELEWSGRAGA